MGSTKRSATRTIQSAVTIDGFSLIWRLHREQIWSDTDGWTGVSIHVKPTEGVRRELYLEYPAAITHKADYVRTEPVRLSISPTKVEAHIRRAMEAGWDPESRGRFQVYEVDELPS
jgi:hypothetical protein